MIEHDYHVMSLGFLKSVSWQTGKSRIAEGFVLRREIPGRIFAR